MCLITYRPSQVTAQLINQDTMYFTTKMLFAHVQAFISSSPNLIQAGILISIYEYAHGKLDTAYSSIANCAKMAHAIGIHKLKSSLDPQENEARLGGDEQKNIWWGRTEAQMCSIRDMRDLPALYYAHASTGLFLHDGLQP
ncbi:hypothetical protein V1517DRAFT_191189 [Lipomyces orientalis]|uniref:Uncharacterized protein n=1 Tax=Lipomyces orientalis TaxID=1233043 RepID=A0ACC3TWM4_9ASCO